MLASKDRFQVSGINSSFGNKNQGGKNTYFSLTFLTSRRHFPPVLLNSINKANPVLSIKDPAPFRGRDLYFQFRYLRI